MAVDGHSTGWRRRNLKWFRRAVWWLAAGVLIVAIIRFGYWVLVPILGFALLKDVEAELRRAEADVR
jgi:hypothetical protein